MTRKSKFITLGILGAVATLGVCGCCCINWAEDPQHQGGGGRGGHGTTHRSRGFVPIFFGGGGGGSSHSTSSPGASSTSRGGFGSTGSHGTSGG